MASVREHAPEAQLEVRVVDLGSLSSIRRFADSVLADHDRLDVLIANAGRMACPLGYTIDGFEMQFGINHLGHFLLVRLLTPLLVAGAPSRLVVLTSAAHKSADIDLDDPHWERRPYDKWAAYGRSKTANILFSTEFDRRNRDLGVRSFAVHPGAIVTRLGRHLDADDIERLQSATAPGATNSAGEGTEGPARWKPVEIGAATTVWAATSHELDACGALYLEDCTIGEQDDVRSGEGGYRSYAVDPGRAEALWELSEILVGLRA